MVIWLGKAEVVASYRFGSWALPTLRLLLAYRCPSEFSDVAKIAEEEFR
jgi:hypothetical protein